MNWNTFKDEKKKMNKLILYPNEKAILEFKYWKTMISIRLCLTLFFSFYEIFFPRFFLRPRLSPQYIILVFLYWTRKFQVIYNSTLGFRYYIATSEDRTHEVHWIYKRFRSPLFFSFLFYELNFFFFFLFLSDFRTNLDYLIIKI